MADSSASPVRTNRVHTQFWADLNNKINITKIENEVWARMSAAAERSENAMTGNAPKPASPVLRRAPPTTAGSGNRTAAANDSDSVRPSSKDSSRHDLASSSKGVTAPGDDGDEATNDTLSPELDKAVFSGTPSEKFAGILGYEELGHVPTLDEFRSEWPKMVPRSAAATPNGPGRDEGWSGVGKGSRRRDQAAGEGQPQQQGAGSVVNDLSKRDEVFRHFKKYYDRADHNEGRPGDALFPAGVNTTGLLEPDFGVIETVGQHTARMQESRSHSRIGEIALLVPGGTTGAARRSGQSGRSRLRSRQGSGLLDTDGRPTKEAGVGGGGDGLTNVFRESMPGSKGLNSKSGDDVSNSFAARSKMDEIRTVTGYEGDRTERNGVGDGSRNPRGTSSPKCTSSPIQGGRIGITRSTGSKEGEDGGCAKASLEGSSTSAELQVNRLRCF